MANNAVMHVRDERPLNLATYATLVVMGGIGISGLSDVRSQLVALGLCAAFGLVFTFGFHRAAARGQMYAYFAAQTLIVALLLALHSTSADSFNFFFYILAVQASFVFLQFDAILWIAIMAAVSALSAWFAFGSRSLFAILFYLVAFAVVGFIGYSLRQAELARRQSQQLLEELRAAQTQLQDLAISEERNRLARELHDSVKQQVFAASMQLGAARASLDGNDAPARDHLELAEGLLGQAQQELNALIHELRPLGLAGKGLGPALRDYVGEWSRQNNIPAALRIEGERTLPFAAEQGLFRVAQEALANVARHSGATQVEVALVYTAQAVTLTITDNGRGFSRSASQKGVGLNSMLERMTALGGTLQVDSGAGQGTRVAAGYTCKAGVEG